jgi:peroxiredoxin
MEPEIRVAYSRIVTISTDEVLVSREWRLSLGVWWPFLADPRRTIQQDLDIQEYTDPTHDPMVPHTIMLEPGLVVHKVYNGYWFWGRPTQDEIRRDFRTMAMRCRPDWDLSDSEVRARWERGEKEAFFPYGKKKS